MRFANILAAAATLGVAVEATFSDIWVPAVIKKGEPFNATLFDTYGGHQHATLWSISHRNVRAGEMGHIFRTVRHDGK